MGEGMGEGRHYCKASCVRIEGASSTAHLSSLENVVAVFEPREVCEKKSTPKCFTILHVHERCSRG